MGIGKGSYGLLAPPRIVVCIPTKTYIAFCQGQKQQARVTVVYMRVSSQTQKPDLANQRAILEQFCAARGLVVDQWVSEIGGGLNFKRPKFLALVDRIVANQVAVVVIAHKDRLVRFGFDLLATSLPHARL